MGCPLRRPGDFDDEATAIAVDGSGNVYVTGESYGSESDYDYATIKYNRPGNNNGLPATMARQMTMTKPQPLRLMVPAMCMSQDIAMAQSDYDYATIKYNSAGQQQWVRRYDGPGARR